MAGPRLFLIDDDREDCADVEAVLGGKYTIFQAHSGDSALEMLDKVGPDVILLDVDFGKGSMRPLPNRDHRKFISMLGGALNKWFTNIKVRE
jgi:CheY-like chemotaxis protein